MNAVGLSGITVKSCAERLIDRLYAIKINLKQERITFFLKHIQGLKANVSCENALRKIAHAVSRSKKTTVLAVASKL